MALAGRHKLNNVILAIDTSAGTSVALVHDGVTLAAHEVADSMRHAEVVGVLIQATLQDAGVSADQITGVAAGMGPGPFTGLRVGIAAAEAFALGANSPLLPMVSHDAIAAAIFAEEATSHIRVVTDARRKEVFWSQYSGVDAQGIPMRNAGPSLAKPEDLPSTSARQFDATQVPAAWLAIIAERMVLAQREFLPAQALYLRSPDVTLSKGPKRVVQ